MTLRQLVSLIRSSHKLLSTDNLITDRYIAEEIKSNAKLLVKRETNLRKLWATDTIFTTIPCLEMEEVPVSECCGYVDSTTVAKTHLSVPRIAEGNYQYLIQGVYSINAMGGGGKKLKEITINRFLNLLKLPMVKREEYYWVMNNHIYVNNPSVKAIRLSAMFEEDVPNELLYPECECDGSTVTDDEWCKNPLDREYALPGYLEKQVLQLTSEKIMTTYFRLPQDVTEEGLDTPNTYAPLNYRGSQSRNKQ